MKHNKGRYPCKLSIVTFQCGAYSAFNMFSAICYIMYNLNVWKTSMEECYFKTKSNTPAWVFFTCFKLYKWYYIAQRITYNVPESHSVFSQISKKELFKTTVNGWKLWLGCECVSVLWLLHFIACYSRWWRK